eukprot:2495706-Lingulodinium_polyedra.AAC.1
MRRASSLELSRGPQRDRVSPVSTPQSEPVCWTVCAGAWPPGPSTGAAAPLSLRQGAGGRL